MLMKHALKNFKSVQSNFNRALFKSFSTANSGETSTNIRFHELYVKELERIQKTS